MIGLALGQSLDAARMMACVNDPSYDVGLRVGREETARLLLSRMSGGPALVSEEVLEEMVRIAAGDAALCPTGGRLAREACAFEYVSAAFGDWRHE